jgi:hypothetical protein
MGIGKSSRTPCPKGPSHTKANVRKEHPMLDLAMVAIALGFFALSIGYAVACDRL